MKIVGRFKKKSNWRDCNFSFRHISRSNAQVHLKDFKDFHIPIARMTCKIVGESYARHKNFLLIEDVDTGRKYNLKMHDLPALFRMSDKDLLRNILVFPEKTGVSIALNIFKTDIPVEDEDFCTVEFFDDLCGYFPENQ